MTESLTAAAIVERVDKVCMMGERFARKAILVTLEAIREPSEAMRKAGTASVFLSWGEGVDEVKLDIAWRAMVDALSKEIAGLEQIAAGAAEERARCAAVADEYGREGGLSKVYACAAGHDIAERIRRGEP